MINRAERDFIIKTKTDAIAAELAKQCNAMEDVIKRRTIETKRAFSNLKTENDMLRERIKALESNKTKNVIEVLNEMAERTKQGDFWRESDIALLEKTMPLIIQVLTDARVQFTDDFGYNKELDRAIRDLLAVKP